MRRPIRWNGAILLMIGLTSCSPTSNPVTPAAIAPQEIGDGFLTIRTEKTVYPRPDGTTWASFAATIVNDSDRLFYARLGDGFSAASEQATLYAAEGSHGFIEQWNRAEWQGVARPVAYEGSAVVELRPRSTYTLHGSFPPASTGDILDLRAKVSLRFRVQYFDDAETRPEQVHQDFSNIFVLTR